MCVFANFPKNPPKKMSARWRTKLRLFCDELYNRSCLTRNSLGDRFTPPNPSDQNTLIVYEDRRLLGSSCGIHSFRKTELPPSRHLPL